MDHILLQIVFIPMLAAGIILFVRSKKSCHAGWITLAALCYSTFLLARAGVHIWQKGPILEGYGLGPNLSLNLLADGLSLPIVRMAFFKKAPLESSADLKKPIAARNRSIQDINGRIRCLRCLGLETGKGLYLFMVLPLAVTAVFSVLFCFFPNTFYILDLVTLATQNLFY